MQHNTRVVARTLFFFLALASAPAFAQVNPGFSEHTLNSDGMERSYLLFVPEGYDGDAMPLVFSFHGSGGYPQNQVDTSRFQAMAERDGVALVFPAGAFTNSLTARSWNANVDPSVDDVRFVRDLIEDVAGMVSIDRKRIYTSGFSGGARMSSRLACELSDVLAAAAPVAGLQYPDDCTLKRPMPVIAFHAVDDPTNVYAITDTARPYWRMGVETALDKWRQANHCSLAGEHDRLSQSATFYQWADCENGAEIQFYQTSTGGHTWPGSDQAGAIPEIDASALIWAFFKKHHLP